MAADTEKHGSFFVCVGFMPASLSWLGVIAYLSSPLCSVYILSSDHNERFSVFRHDLYVLDFLYLAQLHWLVSQAKMVASILVFLLVLYFAQLNFACLL